jgi:adenylate kinase
MLAPPGAGKGTQGTRLAEALGLRHISSGEVLRRAVEDDTPLGREAAQYLRSGRLAPDELVTRALLPVLAESDGFVLDGFPRTLQQAEGLEFDAVVYLNVDEDELRKRLLARGRPDDTPDVIDERLRVYAADTRPLIEHYRAQGVLVEVDGNRAPDEIAADIARRLSDLNPT